MPLAANDIFPLVDAATQDCISDEQADFFRRNGLLMIRGPLNPRELRAMRDATLPLVQRAMSQRVSDPDFFYKKHEITGKDTPFRVEYVIERTQPAKALLGHPFILRSVEKLQGENFIPTWDSMVFKTPGAGAAVPWHRDAGTAHTVADKPIFNVDFYLDEADISNCLWGIPGSNLWSEEQAKGRVEELNAGGFHTADDTVPILMGPGDVIFHNILVLHGSPAAQSALRRVVYYEFRPAEVEKELGPHVPEYIPLKQKLLLACLRERRRTDFAKDEKPFDYRPTGEFAGVTLGDDELLSTYRYPHDKYWRK